MGFRRPPFRGSGDTYLPRATDVFPSPPLRRRRPRPSNEINSLQRALDRIPFPSFSVSAAFWGGGCGWAAVGLFELHRHPPCRPKGLAACNEIPEHSVSFSMRSPQDASRCLVVPPRGPPPPSGRARSPARQIHPPSAGALYLGTFPSCGSAADSPPPARAFAYPAGRPPSVS